MAARSCDGATVIKNKLHTRLAHLPRVRTALFFVSDISSAKVLDRFDVMCSQHLLCNLELGSKKWTRVKLHLID